MKSKSRKELELMLSMFKIGCVGFGGGSALIPVIEKEVVDEQKLVGKEEYDKDVVVASITPGALPVEIATGLGKRAYGVRGMMTSALLMAFPGVLITVLLLSVLSRLNTGLVTQIECISVGVTAFISCLLTEYARKTLAEAQAESGYRFRRAFVILVGVFILTSGKVLYSIFGIEQKPVFALSTIQVLGIAFFGILFTHCKFTLKNTLVSAVTIFAYLLTIQEAIPYYKPIGLVLKLFMGFLAIRGLYRSITNGSKHHKKVSWKPMAKEQTAWILFVLLFSIPAFLVCKDTWLYLGRGLASSIISFGGGDAYLSVADGMFVSTGMVTGEDFYGHLVSIVNVLPGSILCKTLAGVGYYLGFEQTGSILVGFAVALSGFACSVAASGGVFCLIYYIYDCFAQLDVFRLISRWIRPIIAGLLLTVMFSMINQNVVIGERLGCSLGLILGITGVVYLLNVVLLYVAKCKNGVLVVASAVVSLLLCNLVR